MRRKAAITLLAAAMTLAGCTIFSPREAEDPSGGGGSTWIVPRQPKDVFLNLASGLSAVTNSNYERSLSPEFEFVPRESDRLAFPAGTFEGWGKETELAFLNRIKTTYLVKRTVQFGDENGTFPVENEGVGQAEYEGPYEIVLDNGTGEPDVYAGVARFLIVQATEGWMIAQWEDLDVVESFPTSGNLRGTFSSAN